jgi:hypothetical protein
MDDNRKDTADHARELRVYKYLLSFTDLGLAGNDPEANTINKLLAIGAAIGVENIDHRNLPNESLIANQWSYRDKKSSDKKSPGVNRVYVRRVLRCVYGKSLYSQKKEEVWSWPSLSIAKLVSILSSLEAYWDSQSDSNYSRDKLSKVTHSVKSKALQMFSELSFEEREMLKIPVSTGEGLIKKLHEDILNPSYTYKHEEFARIYEQFLSSKTVSYTDNANNLNDMIDGYILDLSSNLGQEESKKLAKRILGEINRIEFQSGAEQLKNILDSFNVNRQTTSINSKMFIRNLTKCIIENEGMTREFPVGIRFFEVKKMEPLPLYIYDDINNKEGMINSKLIEGNLEIDGLERQYAYKVILHFSLYGKSPDKRIDFSEEIIGVGSPISHAMIAMDRVLMWDIPCLQKYFPVARTQFSNNTVTGGNQNSTVWSHHVVQLYRRDEIEEAIVKEKTIEEISTPPISHYGEYCGFDNLEVSIKAAFLARLRALKHILKEGNINSYEYIEQLQNRIQKYTNLCEAKKLLHFYPFSLVVMKAKINSDLRDYIDENDEGQFFETNPGKRWSSVAYDAYLKITEGLIKEGRTVQAKKHLNILDAQAGELSALMLARYYLCWSQYHFLSDLASTGNDNLDRRKAVSRAEEYLNRAEESLKKKLRECELLGELSHSNAHPFFEIYSKISLVKARLYLYFSSHIKSRDDSIWSQAKAPLIEAEKARIYSARDGNAALYLSQSCFEAWTYLILAFTWDFQKWPKEKEEFSKEKCIEWAPRLLKHAIVCYEEIGVKCYSDIKRNAGLFSAAGQPNESIDADKNSFGENIRINGVPFIQEIKPSENGENYRDEESGILHLNLDIFKTDQANLNSFDKTMHPIFFGSDSSNIIFTDGMIELCSLEELKLLPKILSAMRKFIVAWSTSRDGAFCREGKEDGKREKTYFIEEIFDKPLDIENSSENELLEKIDLKKDRYIRGFYPHRISNIAVFSKLFIGVSLLILKCKSKEIDNCDFKKIKWDNIQYEDICKFIEGLYEGDVPEHPPEQNRFNGHLSTHITQILEYFSGFEKWSESPDARNLTLMEVRDKVIKDIFLLVKGQAIKPVD